MPTVVIGNNTGDDYSGVEDTVLHSDAADTAYGSQAGLECKYTSSARNNTLIRFSGLSNIDGPATVSAASVYIYGSNPWDNITLHARRLLRNWSEDNATYNIYNTGNSWTSGGAMSDGNDRVASATGTMTVGTTANYDSFDCAANVEDMINGTINNYGYVISRDTEDSFYYTSHVSSQGTDGQRPYLSVTYTESGGSSHVPGIMQAMNQFNGGM
jgi:hypothetical protein